MDASFLLGFLALTWNTFEILERTVCQLPLKSILWQNLLKSQSVSGEAFSGLTN